MWNRRIAFHGRLVGIGRFDGIGFEQEGAEGAEEFVFLGSTDVSVGYIAKRCRRGRRRSQGHENHLEFQLPHVQKLKGLSLGSESQRKGNNP